MISLQDYAGRALLAPFIAVLPFYALVEAIINIWVFSIVGTHGGLTVSINVPHNQLYLTENISGVTLDEEKNGYVARDQLLYPL